MFMHPISTTARVPNVDRRGDVHAAIPENALANYLKNYIADYSSNNLGLLTNIHAVPTKVRVSFQLSL